MKIIIFVLSVVQIGLICSTVSRNGSPSTFGEYAMFLVLIALPHLVLATYLYPSRDLPGLYIRKKRLELLRSIAILERSPETPPETPGKPVT